MTSIKVLLTIVVTGSSGAPAISSTLVDCSSVREAEYVAKKFMTGTGAFAGCRREAVILNDDVPHGEVG